MAFGPDASTAFSKIFVSACCTFASSNRAMNSARSSVTRQVNRGPCACWKYSTQRPANWFKFPAGARRDCFSCRLNSASSPAISAARAADFSTSSKEYRQG